MAIEQLKQLVSQWALSIHFRVKIYFYGSRLKGTAIKDSDYDLAIEFLDTGINHTLIWMDYHDIWELQLNKITKFKIHLELYDNQNINVRKYVNDNSVILYQSPEEQETYDEEFEKDLASLLNRQS